MDRGSGASSGPRQSRAPPRRCPTACPAARQGGGPATTRSTLYAQQQAYAPEDAGPPADDMEDKLDQLERLGNLKERGVLSEAEFAEQKQRILSG